MAKIGKKFRSIKTGLNTDALGFWCPGCNKLHIVNINGPQAWAFNSDYDKPTFSPSILVTGVVELSDEQYFLLSKGGKIDPTPLVCHSFMVNGVIQYLSDCTHSLAGQNVELPDLPDRLQGD